MRLLALVLPLASGLLVLPTYLNIIELRALDIFGCELISSQADCLGIYPSGKFLQSA